MTRGGPRKFKVCPGSNQESFVKANAVGVGECAVCGRALAMYKDGTVARHTAERAAK